MYARLWMLLIPTATNSACTARTAHRSQGTTGMESTAAGAEAGSEIIARIERKAPADVKARNAREITVDHWLGSQASHVARWVQPARRGGFSRVFAGIAANFSLFHATLSARSSPHAGPGLPDHRRPSQPDADGRDG